MRPSVTEARQASHHDWVRRSSAGRNKNRATSSPAPCPLRESGRERDSYYLAAHLDRLALTAVQVI